MYVFASIIIFFPTFEWLFLSTIIFCFRFDILLNSKLKLPWFKITIVFFVTDINVTHLINYLSLIITDSNGTGCPVQAVWVEFNLYLMYVCILLYLMYVCMYPPKFQTRNGLFIHAKRKNPMAYHIYDIRHWALTDLFVPAHLYHPPPLHWVWHGAGGESRSSGRAMGEVDRCLGRRLRIEVRVAAPWSKTTLLCHASLSKRDFRHSTANTPQTGIGYDDKRLRGPCEKFPIRRFSAGAAFVFIIGQAVQKPLPNVSTARLENLIL